jgi:hypothetical protein
MTVGPGTCDRCGRVGVAGSVTIEVARVGGFPSRVGPRPLCEGCAAGLVRWLAAPTRPPARAAVVDHASFYSRGGVAPAHPTGEHR